MDNRGKVCKKCGVCKPLSDFHIDNSAEDKVKSSCKICVNNTYKITRRTKEGIVGRIYSHQKRSSRHRGHHLPKYSLNELREWCFVQKIFHILYAEWVKGDHDRMLTPSVDRIDDSKGYSFDNIQLMTWKENNAKSHEHFRLGKIPSVNPIKPVIGTHKITGEVIEFISIREAERQSGISNNGISACCRNKVRLHANGKTSTARSAGGYVWKYKINN